MAIDPRAACLALLLLGAGGCFTPRGWLFTRATVPYYLPHEGPRQRAEKFCKVNITRLKEPLTRANLSVMWTDRAVAEAMSEAGMTELRYADLEILSILNSVYERRRLIFYGE
ncbi:MAG: hypothetical protein RBT78_13520 [Kiritimatiellia bacterium]|jgi:hypothetical protein|nr:hypothetical protein [Kiritimatiellia bacterium]